MMFLQTPRSTVLIGCRMKRIVIVKSLQNSESFRALPVIMCLEAMIACALYLGLAYLPVHVGVNSFLYRRLFHSSGIDDRLTQISTGLTAVKTHN